MFWLVLGNGHLGLGRSRFFEKKLESCYLLLVLINYKNKKRIN